jgi:hypothetical protein
VCCCAALKLKPRETNMKTQKKPGCASQKTKDPVD